MSLLGIIDSDVTGSRVFYDTVAGFAETITTTGGSFSGIFDNEFEAIDAEGQIVVNGSLPRVWCRSTDAPGRNAALTIRGANYVVIDEQPNDTAETLLILREA